jgi:apolipoprotein N-acyltransferase
VVADPRVPPARLTAWRGTVSYTIHPGRKGADPVRPPHDSDPAPAPQPAAEPGPLGTVAASAGGATQAPSAAPDPGAEAAGPPAPPGAADELLAAAALAPVTVTPVPRPGRRARARAAVRREWRRSALAAAAGIALALAFPPFGLWVLSPVAVAALALLTRGRAARQGAWTGFAFGVPFFVLLLAWLRVVGWDAVAGLSVIEAVFLAALGAGLATVSGLPGWPVWGGCLWVAEEALRDRLPFGGFPWGRLAFANTGSSFTPLAALGGAPLVTFAVALAGGLGAAAALRLWRLTGPPPLPARPARFAALPARERPLRTGWSVRAVAPIAGALALATAASVAGFAVPVATAPDGSVRIAVVQGNVQRPGLHFLGRPLKILNNHVDATLKLAAEVKAGTVPRPDLVIWPENSSDLDPFTYPQAYARISEAVRAIGVPVLVGTLVDGPDADHVQNEGIVWDPTTGPGAEYTKQHPVPFGEYVPYRKELTKVVKRLDEIPLDFYPGDHTGVLQVGPARLGDVICFEVAYDGIVRDTVNSGARMLVVQTNNATYGRTGEPEQQLAMAKLRAVEHGRTVVTAATSGISAIVEPDGTVARRTREFTQAVISARVPLRDGHTLADRVGAIPEWSLAIVGLLSCGAAIVLARRERDGTKGRQ